jgi:putative spermidine/putrescine transport system permease protein
VTEGVFASEDIRAPRPAEPGRRRPRSTWLGVVPFFLFAGLFLLIPVLYLTIGSFQNAAGEWTIQNYLDLSTPATLEAYKTSIEISLVTALAGAGFGFLLAYAIIGGGLPRRLRGGVMTFSGVASNFAGIPLALAFIFTIGRAGLLSAALRNLGFDPYAGSFSLYTKLGLEIVYFYFQLPLMVLIIAPAIDGLKREWREASENMGASSRQFWWYIGLPVLTPPILGATILLFGNAFGAQATAYQLTGGLLPIVTILIGDQLQGDVLHNVGLGYALAMGMVLIMGLTLIAYTFLQRRSERWMR